jgi:hypothetical protein
MSSRKRTVDHQELLQRLLGAPDEDDDTPKDDRFTKEALDNIPMDVIFSQIDEDEKNTNAKHGGFCAELHPDMSADEFIAKITPENNGRVAPGQDATVPGIERERMLCSTSAPAHVHAEINTARNAPEKPQGVLAALTEIQTEVFCGSEAHMHGEEVFGQIDLRMQGNVTFSVGEIIAQMEHHSMSVWRPDLTTIARNKYVRIFFEMDDPGRFLLACDMACREHIAYDAAKQIEHLADEQRKLDATVGNAYDLNERNAGSISKHADTLRQSAVTQIASHFYITCPCQ